MFKLMRQLRRNKKGAALVEYALIVAGVALISAAAVAIFGHKTSDMISMVAAVLPGAHTDDNGPIVSGKIIETAIGAGGTTTGIGLDITTIVANSGKVRLGNNLGTVGAAGQLVLEPVTAAPAP